MYFRNQFQNGFVTRNLDETRERIDHALGQQKWIEFAGEMMMNIDGRMEPFTMRAALSWSGGYQTELIEPISGCIHNFTARLPDDPSDATPHFHHIAMRRDDETAMRAEIANLPFDTLCEVVLGDATFIMLDARKVFGHHLEYCCMPAENWKLIDWPLDKPAAP